MKYLSLFTGIGGFELGIQQAYEITKNSRMVRDGQKIDSISRGQEEKHRSGMGDKQNERLCNELNESTPTCIGFSEIDKYAAKVYQHHFPTHHNYGDITKINADELPDFDLLVGGFPCQAFSIAGKRGGFSDTRGTLFFDIARILKTKRPALFLLENVKGLLSHDEGNTFRTIISTLDELGYDLQWQVLNSKNHGVPQNRERIFIIGHLRGTSRPEVFPFGGADEKDTRELKYVGQVGDTDRMGDGKNLSRNAREGYRVFSEDGLSPTLRSQLGGASRGSQIIQLNSPTHSNDRIYGEDGISPTLNTMQGGNRQPFVAAMRGRNPENSSDRTVGAPTEQRLEVNTNGTSNTLTSVGRDNLVLEEMKIRRLTPTECERLQGFPDKHTYLGSTIVFDEKGNKKWKDEFISDSQRYKMCGNAVTVNVIRDIMEKLLA